MAYKNYYYVEISHSGLNKYRYIKGTDKHIVEQKALAQKAIWDEMWSKKCEQENKRQKKEKQAKDRESKKLLAAERTQEATKELDKLQDTLHFTLDIDDTIEWESLKNTNDFDIPEPAKPKIKELPVEPLQNNPEFAIRINIFDKIFKSRQEKKLAEAKTKYDSAYKTYLSNKEKKIGENNLIQENYNQKLHEWEIQKENFYKEKKELNEKIDLMKKQYFEKNPESIIEYCDMVLSNSQYPEYFPQEYSLEYNKSNGILIVDYSLPNISVIPSLKEVKYIQSKDEFSEKYLSTSSINKLYDDLLYQIALRSIHELFEADVIDSLTSIVFNGWVESIDKATGKQINGCILSVQVKKDEFLEINLENIEPKLCFKSLKGVGSSKLHSLTPVAPLLRMNKEDKRFIDSYDVSKNLDETYNLAAMEWEDFEHLIREIFEKEFSQNGGEVRVTQASRDGGVDAIAFDPDPIRGGKIVIQAKRYTNTVGVSAVRDLYGTVMNEGAIKGILITTSDYGSDAYSFSKDKPLTLLNGANLLHLLEKHGTKAKIDIREAKRILAENKTQ